MEVVTGCFFFIPIFLHSSTFLTLLILINWLIWSCPVVVKISSSLPNTDAVFGFIKASGAWVDEFQLKLLHKVPFFSVMADECTDITTIEELSVFCRWVEDGKPVEHFFFEILPLKKTVAQSIYLSLINWLKQRNI